jgi:hypothetical protein
MSLKYSGVVVGVFALLLSAPSFSYETETDLIEAKFESARMQQEEAASRRTLGSFTIPQVREPSGRDSGTSESLLFVNNTNFRFVSDIGFYIPKLSVALIPNDPTSPVVFDDPTSFAIRPLNGEVVLSGKALSSLMDEHVFDFKGAPLRNLKLSTQDGGVLTINAEMYRGKWIPLTMRGKITLEDGHILVYTPSFVSVAGNAAINVLIAANVLLDELLTVKAKGAVLKGSQIVLDTLLLFPPPKLLLNIASAKVEKRGLVLTFAADVNPDFPPLIEERASNMVVSGGEVKFMRALPMNAYVQIVSDDEGSDLDFNLYEYRRQLTAGYLKLGEDGSILAHLRNYNALAGSGN